MSGIIPLNELAPPCIFATDPAGATGFAAEIVCEDLSEICKVTAPGLEAVRCADWLFEVKRDGFWSLAYIDSGTCKLVSRNEYEY